MPESIPDQDDGNDQPSSQVDPEFLWQEFIHFYARVVPGPVHWLGYYGNRCMEENEPERDEAPEEKGDQPVLIMTMQDQAGNPPAREKKEDEKVDKYAILLVQSCK